MSQTFTLIGNSSVLSVNYYPPIELKPSEHYCLGLIGFHTYNSIPNIEKDINNSFVYGTANNEIKIPEGSYEISDIERFLQNYLYVTENLSDKYGDEDKDKILSLKPNNNTLKVEIKSIYDIDFSGKSSLGTLLGFSGERILKANTLQESNLPVEIIKVSSVRLECNIVTGAYYDNKLSHTLYEFSPSVDPGFAINIEPQNILYLPVNSRLIDNITVRILDQNGQLVNLRGEKIIIRLELKQIS